MGQFDRQKAEEDVQKAVAGHVQSTAEFKKIALEKDAKEKEEARKRAEAETDVDEVMRKYDRESNTRIWEGTPKVVISIMLAAFSVYCIFMTLFSTALPETRLSLFLAFVTIVGYMMYPIRKNHVRPNHMPWYDIVLMAVGAACFFYFAFNATEIIHMGSRIQPLQIAVALVGTLILMELCRRCVGIPILVVVICLLVYVFYWQFNNGTNLYMTLRNLTSKLFYSTSGLIGTPINVCYTYIVLFIIFGAFLERTGIANFFISFANRLTGWSSGGPAKVAVISSALCGMVSGSSVGNTVTTGSFTIPMMKKTGYKPEFAGAVEAAASTGGQIMPPIMGAAAFLMAEYIGIPYAKVAVKAILPAILYFTGIFISVHLEAKKLGLRGIPRDQLPKWGLLARDCYLILPLILLVWLVSSGAKTMSHSAAYSILAAIAVGLVNFFLTRMRDAEEKSAKTTVRAIGGALADSGKSAVDSLEAGAKGAITVAVACAMAGIIAGCITVTGLASILINAIVQLAGNATFIGLILTMVCCIILGMGVPTTANYCIMASTCAPILIKMGYPLVAAHFFVFYFGIVADITPPVALAAYAGSAIAKSNPMKTGINATKLAIAAFIVPFIFAYNPQMLFENVTSVFQVVQIVITALLGIFAVAAGLEGYILRKMGWPLRVLAVIGGLTLLIPGTVSDLIGLVIVAGIIALQLLQNKREPSEV